MSEQETTSKLALRDTYQPNGEKMSVFDPRWMDVAARITNALSKSNLVPVALRGKPADILLVLMKGYELGIQPTQALSELYVINGKVGMSASLIMGLCVSRKDVCQYFSLADSTPRYATYVTQRVGSPKPVEMTYTIEEASVAGLTSNANWKKFPSAMLRARAAAALARVVYPDLTMGLYTKEELSDGLPELEVASPVAQGLRDPQGDGGRTPEPGRAATAVWPVGSGSPLTVRTDGIPESDQPPSEEVGYDDGFPSGGMEEPDSVPSVQPPPPVGRFDQQAFLLRAKSSLDYRARLKLTKELYAALQRKEITPLEAEALRRQVQEKR